MLPSYPEFERSKSKKFDALIARKGIVSRINFETWTADIQVIGDTQSVVKNVPLSGGIPLSISVGDRCGLQTFDESNPDDIIVSFVYGRRLRPLTSAGSASIPVAVNTSVPHGLGFIPNMVSYVKADATANTFYERQPPDATNLYLTGLTGTVVVRWYAAVL